MIDAAVCEGGDVEAAILIMFGDPQVAYIHLHNAKRGCFSCRVDRAEKLELVTDRSEPSD
jgi:hypothetical protein